jgi:hypothetical protein
VPQQSSTKASPPQRKRPPLSSKQENKKILTQEREQPSVKEPIKNSIKKPIQPPVPVQSAQTRRNWLIATIMLILLSVASWYVLSGKLSSPTPPPVAVVADNDSQTATHSLLNSNVEATASALPTVNWQTFQTLSGHDTQNATQKTQTFSVPAKWQLSWACQGTDGVDDWLYIVLYNANGSLYDAGSQNVCLAAQKVVGSIIETKTSSSTIYLTIDANTDWTITMRAPQ